MKIKMLMAFVALLLFSAFTADRTITIFMIGDSTMANILIFIVFYFKF
jgi:pectinesterase